MTDLTNRQKNDLDNYITGHYGEDQFKDEGEPTVICEEHVDVKDEDCETCKIEWEQQVQRNMREPEIDEDKFPERQAAFDRTYIEHADDCECDDCHDRDPLNGPRMFFTVALCVIMALLFAYLFWIRLFG